MSYENYYKRRGRLRLGFATETIISSQDFFANYTASILAAPQFNPIPEAKTIFLEKLRVEKEFSLLQSSKILHINNMTIDDLFNDNNKKIQETTNATGYHIIKSLYLHNMDDFISCFDENIATVKITNYQISDFSKKINAIQVDPNSVALSSLRMTSMATVYDRCKYPYP